MARFGNARQEDRASTSKKAPERQKHRSSQPFEKFTGWDVTTDFDDLSLDVWAKQTSQQRQSNSRRHDKVPSKYLITMATRCSGLENPADVVIVTLADELKENSELPANHDSPHKDDFAIQKRAIEKEIVAQRVNKTQSDQQNGKTSTVTKSTSTKNESLSSRLPRNVSTKHEHLEEHRSSKSIDSATFSKLLSLSSNRNQESDHASNEASAHLANGGLVAGNSTSGSSNERYELRLSSENGKMSFESLKSSSQEVQRVRSPWTSSNVESRGLLPSVKFTYTKAKSQPQRPESGISLSSSATEQTEGSGSSVSTLQTIESSEDSKSSSTRSAAVTTTGSSSGESGPSSKPTGPELPPVNASPTLMGFPSDGIAKFFTSWARSFAESVKNEDDRDFSTDIFARYSSNKRAFYKARSHNSARENTSQLQNLKDSRTSRSAPSLSTAEDDDEEMTTSSNNLKNPLVEIRRDPRTGEGSASPNNHVTNYPIRDVLPDGKTVQRGLPGRKLKAPDVVNHLSSPTRICIQDGGVDDVTAWSTPPMYQGDVIIVKDGVDLEKLRDQNLNGPPAFRPQHVKTPLQRARDIVQRRLGNPAAQPEIPSSPTSSPPRRWKSSYSNMYEPTKQRSGESRAQSEQSPRAQRSGEPRVQSEQSPRAHSKHTLSQNGQMGNPRPSRDGIQQKAETHPALRDRHELASNDPWNYVMQYMGRTSAIKTSSNGMTQ